jgi:hypothetical protein
VLLPNALVIDKQIPSMNHAHKLLLREAADLQQTNCSCTFSCYLHAAAAMLAKHSMLLLMLPIST